MANKKRNYRIIATEEAFITKDIVEYYKRLNAYNPLDQYTGQFSWAHDEYGPMEGALEDFLTDLDGQRLKNMDEWGVDMMLLEMTAPGVQVFEPDLGSNLAKDANDQLADVIQKHPTRFAGMTCVAPQAPEASAKEIERCMQKLGFSGVIINSHTNNEYLDHYKYWPILESAAANNAPIYLHPRRPSEHMRRPFLAYGMQDAMFGFQVETSTHALRLILSGVFDRFPNLKIVLGHMGEGLPYWLYRIDYMNKSRRIDGAIKHQFRKLQREPSAYFRENYWITTSGMEWGPVQKFAYEVLGPNRIMYAIDYPYQRNAPYSISVLEGLEVPEEEKKKMFETNAVNLFNIRV